MVQNIFNEYGRTNPDDRNYNTLDIYEIKSFVKSLFIRAKINYTENNKDFIEFIEVLKSMNFT